ncbi:unannotated protein [freshwater metagenome]|uniref:Unannotated protein n=1 Tax=freshwater metagenome TaxID=449393 RepID=A0A6J7M176_9ZZZZ
MLAEIFHWWLGVGLTIVAVGLVFGIIGGYLKKVVAPQYPGRRQRREED